MRLKAVVKISVLQLFVHDAYDVGQFDESVIAEALTRYLRQETNLWNEVKVDPPSGLSRFTLGDLRHRMRSVAEIRESFPDKVVEALERLEVGTWTISDEGGFERG